MAEPPSGPATPTPRTAAGASRALFPSFAVRSPATARSRRHDRRRDPLSIRIAAVPFTLSNLREDLEDLGSNFDGAPDLEFRMASKALELEQSGLSYQRIPPDCRFPYGPTPKQQGGGFV